MTLLVTGANGHVGATVMRRAAEAGIPAVGLVRSLDRVDGDLARASGERATWVAAELSDPFEIAAALAEHRVDGCIHSAAVPNDRLARPAPWRAVAANVTATAALLEVARRQGWRRFVHVSTGSVFQTLSDFTQPVPEDHVTSAFTVYGATKRSSELVTRMYRHDFGLSAAVVRISFVYGPPLVPRFRDLPRGPVVALLREAVLGEAIREPSGGDFQASFTHVEDVADGLLAAWRADALHHDVYHLGHGRNWTTFEVADAIRKAVPGAVVEVGPGTEPWTTYNTMRGPLSGDRLREDAGFVPRLPLEDGVAAFADWMRENRETLT